MKSHLFEINSLINFNSGYLKFQNQIYEENYYNNNQLKLKNNTKDEENANIYNFPFYDYQNYNYNDKVIYEPEYFLNVQHLNQDDSSCQIEGKNCQKQNEFVFQMQNFHNIYFNEREHQSKTQLCYKEEQLSKNNMFQQQKLYQNYQSGYDNINNQSQQFNQCQNNLDNKNQIIEDKQNVFGLYFQEIRDDDIPLFIIKQDSNSEKNFLQKLDISATCDVPNYIYIYRVESEDSCPETWEMNHDETNQKNFGSQCYEQDIINCKYDSVASIQDSYQCSDNNNYCLDSFQKDQFLQNKQKLFEYLNIRIRKQQQLPLLLCQNMTHNSKIKPFLEILFRGSKKFNTQNILKKITYALLKHFRERKRRTIKQQQEYQSTNLIKMLESSQ
ncbi:hypothetical protein ABPG72_006702 [Tetrahymena utriculariae]